MNIFRKKHTLDLRPLKVTAAGLTLLLLALVAPAGADAGDGGRFPDLGDCQRLQVESGNMVAFKVFGVGTQDYQWNGSRWVFVTPEAVLYADAGDHGVVGTHFGGPTWESLSGSKVVATVMDFCTPDPNSIPWVLLKAASTEGPGIFDKVTFVQRLNTVGGNAPSVPGDFVGQVVKVPYTADYVFYRKHP